MAVGDLNGDGRPDVAAANYAGSTVSLFLGNGDGTFQPVQTVTVFNRPNAVAVADLNGDGKSDLAVTNHESQVVSVHFNTTMPGAATLTFAPPGQYATRGMPQSMLIADLNGDGKPDLTMANFGHADVGVYFNTTEIGAAVPSFTAQQSFLARFSPISPVAADLNGDGRLDLAVANNNDRSVSVLLGNPSGTLQFNSADLTVTEGAGSATITLTRTGSTDGQVSAIVSLTGGSATQGQDFIFASPQTVTWADGDGGNQTITIPIAQDTFVEGSETALFTLTLLANPFGATLGAKTTTALTIANTPKDGLSIENGDRAEGNDGIEQITFRVSLAPPHTQTVTVQYATSDGTAIAGKDYVATSGTLTFAPGETTKFVTVQVFGDLLDEPDETLHVTLSNPTQVSLGVAQATGKIHNDDSPGTCTPRPRITVDVAANGNALQVHVEPTPPHTGATNRLQQLRFGTLQNATVTLNGQAVTSGQSVLMPTSSQAADFVVTRVAAGQPTTVPLTVVDGCGEWQTFVGGGAGAGF